MNMVDRCALCGQIDFVRYTNDKVPLCDQCSGMNTRAIT
jgi:hypothetical protein